MLLGAPVAAKSSLITFVTNKKYSIALICKLVHIKSTACKPLMKNLINSLAKWKLPAQQIARSRQGVQALNMRINLLCTTKQTGVPTNLIIATTTTVAAAGTKLRHSFTYTKQPTLQLDAYIAEPGMQLLSERKVYSPSEQLPGRRRFVGLRIVELTIQLGLWCPKESKYWHAFFFSSELSHGISI
jgi:hypothetical protein